MVSKRGTMPLTYPSDLQAKKLWKLLQDHKAKSTASFTYGALDPVQVIQMAKYLDTIYISGWQSSSTASTSNEPGPDLADYPMVNFTILIFSRTLFQTRSNICFWPSCFMIGNRERKDSRKAHLKELKLRQLIFFVR